MPFWKSLNSVSDVDEAIKRSSANPVLIFKHSTRCALSSVAKRRLERSEVEGVSYYLLDVIKNREVSNSLALSTGVRHESPQAFLYLKGDLLYNDSHLSISTDDFVGLIPKSDGETI